MTLELAQDGISEPGDRLSTYLIDSTKIDQHKLKANPKCLRGKAGFGHTHESGYIGFKLHVVANRKGQNVAFIAKPTAAMADMRWYFDRNWARLYKKRQVVEGVFSRLKNRFRLLASSCRSTTSLSVRVLASIGAYNL